MTDLAVVLASASPRRRALLARLVQPFHVAAANVDESMLPGEAPDAYALRLAEKKALAAPVASGRTVVLGADTIVVLDGEVLGKPSDAAQASEFLRRLRGRAHDVLTAVAVAHRADGRVVVGLERTVVRMRPYTDGEIAAYVATGDPFDKAGAYAIQHRLFRPVASIDGSYSNVMGLPLALASRLLAEVGVRGMADPVARRV